MKVNNDDIGKALKTMLLLSGFAEINTFGEFITYQRAGDPLKVHVGPDGSFTALDGEETVICEGIGGQDLFMVLVERA